MRLILEPRHLFDGSVPTVAAKAAHSAFEQAHHHPAGQHHEAGSHHASANDAVHRHPAVDAHAALPALAPQPHASEILFVDPRVSNWQSLVAGVGKDVQVVLIDPTRDGISQVTSALQGRSNLQAIQFLTYGSSGQIEFGNTPVTADTLALAKQQVASWSDHLAANADIEFWGCDVGQGAAGQQFVDTVHALTGAQVGASMEPVGASALGGVWTLDRTTGVLAVGAPFSAAAMSAYQGVLDAPVPTVTFVPGTVPGDVLLGNTFTETVSFANTATTAVGYGPFIDLFVPSDAAHSATLTGASYLGSSVTFQAITLSTNIPGHVGELGALHPLALDSSGNPLFVAAPAGYQAGDTMYVLQLPFGSYTPGEPAAQIQLSFTMSGTTELSSMHGGQTLNIAAIGGFQYGADPLNNPATDPSIRGTIGDAGESAASDGLVTASSTVSLIEVSATTDLHEGETATGPDYPFDYVITLAPAHGTQADPMSNVTFTFNLPDQVQYTNGTIAITGPGGVTGTATFHSDPTSVNGAGGTVTVTFSSLYTDASNTATVIKIPVFVPQFDASGASILGTAGQPRTIDSTAIYSYTGSWTAPAGSVDHGLGAQTIAGDSSTNTESTSFVAKSLAIQVVDDAPNGNIVPGEIVTYSIEFQVSDYYSLNQLNIADVIGDGITLLAPGNPGYATPTLQLTSGGSTHTMSFGDAANNVESTVNGQAVAASGSNSNWNYTRDDAGATANPGATTVSFGVGALLEAELGGAALASVLEGGAVQGGGGPTQGVITFVAKVLDKYTNANSGNSVREKDSITDSVTTAGTSATVVTVDNTAHTITANDGTVTDGSAVTNSVAPGQLVLTVVAVNGQTADLTDIKPGDTVTYGMTYTLNNGDYGNLDLTAYLPLPVFSTTDPHSNGGSVATFTNDSADPYPTAGTYKLVNPLSGETTTPTVSVDGTANSISFNFGDRDDPTNAAGQQVVVYFSVVASNKPFANGLQLTTQGGSSYTNAEGQTVAAAAIKQVPLEEPELAVKTGVVSIVGDGGGNKGTYAADTTNSATVPWTAQTNTTPSGGAGSPFAPAGTAAGTSPFTGNGDPLAADNLNVTGGDGGDLARVVSTVQNQGGSSAYDVTIEGTLPAGFAVGSVQNFAIYNSAGVQIDTGVTAAQYFGAGGVQLASPIAAHDQIYVVYDLKVPTSQETGDHLTLGSNIVNWASVAGGVASGNGFVSGTGAAAQPVGENAAALADNASIQLAAPTVAKTVVTASDVSDVPLGAGNNVALGETVTYSITVTLPQGTTLNGATDVTLTDSLPAGMTFTGLNSVTFGSGVSTPGGPAGVTATVSGGTITFDLGSSLTNSRVDANGTITLVYTARLDSTDTPADGTARTNSAVLNYDNGLTTAPATATIHEVDPHVTETIAVKDTNTGTTIANNGTVYSNENLTYTVTLKNTGDAPAQNLADLLDLPAGLTYVPGSLTYLSGGTGGSTSDTSGLALGLTTLGAGQTATFTFQASVTPNQTAGSSITVNTPNDGASGTYYSQPGTAQGHLYTDTASATVKIGQITPVLSITGESNNTDTVHTPSQTNTQTSVVATVGEIVTLHGYVQIPEGANPTTLSFTLPPGLDYLGDGSATIALVSPNGDLISSLGTLSGVAQLQDGNPAGANYVSPGTGTTTAGDVATFHPTTSLPGSVVTQNGNQVSIDLGTLTNNDGSAIGNYVIIEFNAVVANTASNVQGTAMTTSYSVGGTTSNTVSVSVEEPAVSVTKTATAVDNATNTVTYQVTVKNTGGSTAYNVSVDDPAVANESNVTFVSATGAGSGGAGAAGTNPNDLNYAIGQLAAGGTEVITYTVQVAPGQTVHNDTVDVDWQSLPGVQTFNGSTAGAAGTTTGARDGDGNAVNTYHAAATTQIANASGRVWQDLGNDPTTYATTGGSADTPLAGVTVTARITEGDGTVITETTTTAADGTYTFGALPQGSVVISLPGAGSNGLPGNETLVYNDGNAITGSPASTSFTANGDAHANLGFSYRTPDTAPVIAQWGGNTDSYTEGGAPVRLSGPGASITDTQLDALNDYGNAMLTLQRYVGGTAQPSAADVFSSMGPLVLAGGVATYNGVSIGSYVETGGKLSITFSAGVTAATVDGVLDNLTYRSTDTGTVSTGIRIGATLDDGNTTGAQGTGGPMTGAPVFVTINEIPAAGSTTATFVEPNDAPPAGVAVAVDPTVQVTSNDTFSGATVQVGNFRPGEDVLVAGTLPAGVTASFDATTGTMTLSGTNLDAATIQSALRAIRYYDASDTPVTTPRNVTISVMDTVTNQTTTAALASIDVVATNDSPVLAGHPVTATSIEDNGAPAGAVGMLVSQLTGNGNVTDADGANAHDGQTPGATGVAITAADTTEGTWWYTTDNGAHWTEFAGAGVSAISSANALHLVADANTRVYFEPAQANWNGAVNNALTFRGWDQFDGVANGTISALPTGGTLGQGVNTASSAYSSAIESIPLQVVAVNDAPVASGSAAMPTIAEDTTSPAPQTVGSLFGAHFDDSADQQRTASNPTGSVADTLAGIAITGNAADPGEGAWQYSTDNGKTWQTVPATGLSDSNALVLSSSAELRFVPTADFNGVPGQLTTRLIETSPTAVANTVTGDALAAGDLAIAGVDVSGAHHGGSTSVSAQTVALGIDVTPVNDAPVATGTAALPPVSQAERTPTGGTVASLFGGTFDDHADQQQSASNPTGSVANTLAGIAIVGDAATAAQGAWQYSGDGGKTWTDIPAGGLSDGHALILSASDSLRFLPSGTFSGTPGALSVRLIDSSGPAPVTDASGVDLGAVGGITRYSAATVDLTTKITPVNVPVVSAQDTLIPDFNAPNDYNKFGHTVDPNAPFALSPDQPFPDDNALPPAEGRGYRPDAYSPPIIPQVWLTGSVGSRFIIEEQQSVIALPSDLFNDSYPNAELHYEARSPGGGALPQWLTFDARSLTFTGTPPLGSHGTVEVEIVAHDAFGNEATATFQITVGRESRDVEQMMKHADAAARQAKAGAKANAQHPAERGHADGHAPSHARGPAHRGSTASLPMHEPLADANADGRTATASPRDTLAAARGRSAFSAQLRDAGPIGRIMQAREIVSSVVGAAGEIASETVAETDAVS